MVEEVSFIQFRFCHSLKWKPVLFFSFFPVLFSSTVSSSSTVTFCLIFSVIVFSFFSILVWVFFLFFFQFAVSGSQEKKKTEIFLSFGQLPFTETRRVFMNLEIKLPNSLHLSPSFLFLFFLFWRTLSLQRWVRLRDLGIKRPNSYH